MGDEREEDDDSEVGSAGSGAGDDVGGWGDDEDSEANSAGSEA